MLGRVSGNRGVPFGRMIDARNAGKGRIAVAWWARGRKSTEEGRSSSWVHFAFSGTISNPSSFQPGRFSTSLNVLISILPPRNSESFPRSQVSRRAAPHYLRAAECLCTLREGSTYSRVNSDRFAAVREVTSRMTIMRTLESWNSYSFKVGYVSDTKPERWSLSQ